MNKILIATVLLFGFAGIAGARTHHETPLPSGVTMCIAKMNGDFDQFVIGEMSKQQVNVTIINAQPDGTCDPAKSGYTMTGSIEGEGKSFSARNVFGLRFHLRDEVQGAVKLVENSSGIIRWAGDSDRGEAKKVAEHIVNQMLKQRATWIPSPINR